MKRKHLETQFRRLMDIGPDEPLPDMSDIELQGLVSILGRRRTDREERGDRPKRTRRR